MKIYQWGCLHCHQIFRNKDKAELLTLKENHLSYCGKPIMYTSSPKSEWGEPIDTIEIISYEGKWE